MTISKPDLLTTDNSGKYKMSIRLRPGGLSFSGFIPSVGESFFYEEVPFDRSQSYSKSLEEVFYSSDFLSWDYKQVSVLVNTSQYTLVPQDIFKEKRKDELLSFVCLNPVDRVLSYPISEESLHIVYGMDNDAYEFCSRSFLNPTFIPSAAPLIALWNKENSLQPSSNLYVLIEGKQMMAVLYSKSRLILVNSYLVEKPEDMMYYILYIWKQYALSQQEDTLYLYADPELRSLLQSLLQTYLRRVQQSVFPAEAYLLDSNIGKVPMDIIALSICG